MVGDPSGAEMGVLEGRAESSRPGQVKRCRASESLSFLISPFSVDI